MGTTEGPRDGGPIDPQVWMAAERTLLAWVRTGLATMGLGFVVAKFALFLEKKDSSGALDVSLWVGTTLVAAGVVMNLIAAVVHVRELRRMIHGESFQPSLRWAGIAVAVGIALVGMVVAVTLIATTR